MADTLLTGTTLVEKESRSVGDTPVGGIIEWNESGAQTPTLPEGFVKCDGQTLTDPNSIYNGTVIPNLNERYYSMKAVPDFHVFQGTYTDNGTTITSTGANLGCTHGIHLPQGAIVTKAISYGNTNNPSMSVVRYPLASGSGINYFSGSMNSEAEGSMEIDNNTYSYQMMILSVDNTESVEGGRITYTSPTNKIKIMRIK